LLSAIVGLYTVLEYDFFDIKRIKWEAILYHCICLYLFLSPVVYLTNKYSGSTITMLGPAGLRWFTYITIVLGLTSIIVVIPKLATVFSFDELSYARSRYYSQGRLHEEGGTDILN